MRSMPDVRRSDDICGTVASVQMGLARVSRRCSVKRRVQKQESRSMNTRFGHIEAEKASIGEVVLGGATRRGMRRVWHIARVQQMVVWVLSSSCLSQPWQEKRSPADSSVQNANSSIRPMLAYRPRTSASSVHALGNTTRTDAIVSVFQSVLCRARAHRANLNGTARTPEIISVTS